ncbi:MAG: hypothetical protein DLM53_07195 [Candidatus Eremiobacter antarcticus]|nr:hypothetical protein [Candidatus Eremiobacteraeota bacterium]MBC5807243.1 hypothetical protein [Candidatus Eremiobacteraeota bacterium]PZR61934.1 MAG: hypothetical protein DLM53_07195 [Candidatus Eremiobacter sp. RRmetagenome_bin22]
MAIGPEQSQYEIPRSRGIPPVVRLLFGLGLLTIFIMSAISIIYAHEFHRWPAATTDKTPVYGSFR